MKKHLLVYLFLFSFVVSNAQFSSQKVLDLNEKDAMFHYKTFLVNNKGVVVTYDKYYKPGNMRNIQFDQYDTNLNFISNKNYKVKCNWNVNRMEVSNGEIGHMLFYNFDGDFTLLTIDMGKDGIKKIEGKLPKNFKAKELIPIGDIVYIPGYTTYTNTVVTISILTGKTTITKPKFKNIKAAYYRGHQKIEGSNEVLFHFIAFPSKKSSDILVISADENGNLKPEVNLSATIDPLILSGRVFKPESSEKVIFGTYSKETRFFPQGFYFSKSTDIKIEKPIFYAFNEITNFEKLAKLTSVDYSVVLNDLIKVEDGYILTGECYYHDSKGVSTSTGDEVVFKGHQYTHAFAVKLNLDGKMIWNTSFPMYIKDKPYADLSRKHSIMYNPPVPVNLLITKVDENKNVHFLFANDNKLVSLVYNAAGKFMVQTEEELAPNLIKEKKEELIKSELKFWYNDDYLTSGIIVKKGAPEKKEDNGVFYLQKLKLETPNFK